MKIKLFLLIGMVVVMFSVGWIGYAQKEKSSWEYTVIRTYSNADLQAQLNGLGGLGWQLVSATEHDFGNSGQRDVTLYLKRAR